jgi:hypothetical protein
MASNLRKYLIPIPYNGLNDTDDDSLIGDNQVSYVRNVDFKPDGFGISKGFEKYNTYDFGANEIQSMLEYQKDGTKSLMAVSNSTLKKQATSSTWTDIGAVASNMVEGVNINCAFYTNSTTVSSAVGDKLLLLDGTDFKFYDGTSLASVPSYTPTTNEEVNPGKNILITNPDEIKKAKYIQMYMNRVWVAKGRNLRFSDTSTGGGYIGNYFPATFVFGFPLDITGFAVKGKPIVFTDSKVYVIKGSTAISTDLDRYRYEEVETEAGCSNHRTIGLTNNGLIWLHRSGVYRLVTDGDTFRVKKISKGESLLSNSKIQKFIDSKTDTQITTAFAVVGNDEYKLKFDDGTVAIFDLINQVWTIRDGRKGKCGINFDGKVLYAGQYVWKMDTGLNNDGEAVISEVHGKNSNLNLPTFNKDYDTWTISVRSDETTYILYPSYEMDGIKIDDVNPIINRISKWGEFCFGDPIRTTDITLNRPVSIKKGDERFLFKWKIKSIDLNHQWQIIGQFLEYKAREMS